MNNDLKTAENLERAAQYIVEHGHTKHRLRDMYGQVCAIGAVMMGVSDTIYRPDYSQVIACVKPLAENLGPVDFLPLTSVPGCSSWNQVVAWNNAPERTQEEVVDLFLLTAAALRVKAKVQEVPGLPMVTA